MSVTESVKNYLKETWKDAKEYVPLFLWGSLVDKKMQIVRKEANDENDELLLLLFGDYLGIPNPISYYMMELLPYVADEIPGWQRRMQNRSMRLADKASQYEFDG